MRKFHNGIDGHMIASFGDREISLTGVVHIMTIPTRILFRHMEKSEAVETEVKHQVETLGRFYSHMTDCHVTIEAPHRHHHTGWKFKVTIKIEVPGDCIVVSHSHEDSATHEDCYATVRDAFRSAKRQLQDYARIRRHQVKAHGIPEKRLLQQSLEDDEGIR